MEFLSVLDGSIGDGASGFLSRSLPLKGHNVIKIQKSTNLYNSLI